MKIAILVGMFLGVNLTVYAGLEPVGKDSLGRDYFTACVYQNDEGIYDSLCDEAEFNSKYAAPKNRFGCIESQAVIKSYSPIQSCSLVRPRDGVR